MTTARCGVKSGLFGPLGFPAGPGDGGVGRTKASVGSRYATRCDTCVLLTGRLPADSVSFLRDAPGHLEARIDGTDHRSDTSVHGSIIQGGSRPVRRARAQSPLVRPVIGGKGMLVARMETGGSLLPERQH